MKKTTLISALALTAFSVALSSCRKDNSNPEPVEQELITTVKLKLRQGSDSTTYTYKVENGFNNATPGIIIADTLHLMPGTAYNAEVTVLNEKASPVENTTEEILEERNAHLFLYISTPATGNGSVTFSGGSSDFNSKPFNQTGALTSGGAGSGTLDLYLMHEPTDKTGATPDAAGGETDLHATFPVRIQ